MSEGTLLTDVKGVYFDLDDTLCAYWDAAREGLRKTFEALCSDLGTPAKVIGHWATEFRAFCPTLKGTDWYGTYLQQGEPCRTELMRLVLLRFGIDDPARARILGDRYAEERDKTLRLFDDAVELLENLHGTFPIGLITNGPADVQRQEIATLKLERYCDHIFIEGEMGRGKPHVEVFRQAQAAVGLEPHQILFVGNSYGHDIAPAINAGWRTAWIRRRSDVPPSAEGENPKPESLPVGAHEPDLTIGSLSELIPLLSP